MQFFCHSHFVRLSFRCQLFCCVRRESIHFCLDDLTEKVYFKRQFFCRIKKKRCIERCCSIESSTHTKDYNFLFMFQFHWWFIVLYLLSILPVMMISRLLFSCRFLLFFHSLSLSPFRTCYPFFSQSHFNLNSFQNWWNQRIL